MLRLRNFPIRRTFSARPWRVLSLLSALYLMCVAAALLYGSKHVSVAQLWSVLTAQAADRPSEFHYLSLVIDARAVRTLAVSVCGASLGLAGALMQGLTRNLLADSGLLGINAGAAAMIVSAAFLPSLPSDFFGLAFVGALLTALLIGTLSLKQQSAGFLILAGTAVSACLFAYVQAVAQLNPAVFNHYRFWGGGSFAGVGAQQIVPLLPFFAAATVLALASGPYVNLITLDKQTARSFGANIALIRAMVLLSASLLSAVAVAIAGPIAFVGLGAAHIARTFIGQDFRFLLPASLINGAVLLCLADTLARCAVRPSEIATGIVTAFVGALLLYVLTVFGKIKP